MRDAQYHRSWGTADRKVLHLYFTPAGDAPLTLSGGGTGSPTIIEIPDDALDVDSLTEIAQKFNLRNVGFPETPTLEMTWELNNLNGSADLRDLRDYLMAPEFAGGGSIDRYGTTRTFDTANMYELVLTDEDGSNAFVLFRGVQRANESTDVVIDEGTIAEKLTVTVVHALRDCAERVLAEDVSEYYQNYWASLFTGGSLSGKTITRLYEYAHNDTAHLCYRRIRLPRGTAGEDSSLGVSLPEFFAVIEGLMTQVYRKLYRNDFVTVVFQSHFQTPGETATPWDHWRFFAQNGTQANTRGTEFSFRYLRFAGVTWNLLGIGAGVAGFTYAGDGTGAGANAGSKHNISAYPTMWDFLSKSCEAALAKGVFSTFGGSLNLYFAMIKEPVGTTSFVPIKKSDMAAGTKTFKIRQNTITFAQTSITGGGGDDRNGEKYPGTTTGNDRRGQSIPLVFHNQPFLGSPNSEIDDADDRRSLFYTMPADVLFYLAYPGDSFGTPSGLLPDTPTATAPVGMRPHNQVRIYVSATETFLVGAGVQNPSVGDSKETARAKLLAAQKTACMGVTTAQVCVVVFGEKNIYVLPDIQIPLSMCHPDWLGNVYKLVDDSGTVVGPNLLLSASSTYLDVLHTGMVAIESKIKPNVGTALVTFLGMA